ncbi:hypothetical protein [Bradyrhizobium shewense]|uniref:hypothetical protein n=1 Tax=Bradyrhizobium shewense TaxID=1761772 RepID=UPI00101AE91D|nr:hypothetical protein [Bradyrhizobium shewense]
MSVSSSEMADCRQAIQSDCVAKILRGVVIIFRGANIKPRDFFDMAAASVDHSAELIREVNPYRKERDRNHRSDR